MLTVSLEGQAPKELRGGFVAIGNFDGLHAGHRAVIEAAKDLGAGSGPWIMATFDPSPRDLFAPNQPSERIHTPRQRARVLERMGVDGCVLIPFDRELSQQSDEAFVDDVLIGRLGAKGCAVGFDFRFGRGRMGDTDRLVELGRARGIAVEIVPEVSDSVGKLSSTRIRQAIISGRLDDARSLLGDWWVVDAVVEGGEKRGRTLGFPTANMRLEGLVHPPFGVYAVFAREEGAKDWLPGVASFGRTPTTGLREPLLEVHLLDVSADLYGRRLETAFVSYLRAEERYESIEDLTAQMHKDREQARAILAAAPPPA